MNRIDVKQLLAYGLVGALSISAAFAFSLKFFAVSAAQPAPSNQAAPPPQPPLPGPASGASQPAAPADGGGDTSISDLEGFLEPFIYDVVNRRDPFMAYVDFVPASSGPSRPLSPAQKYDLDQLKLIGIMWDIKDPKAMFLDPDSQVLVLGRDEGIGNKNGYIAAIREGEVVVVEAIRKRGDIIYKTRILRMER